MAVIYHPTRLLAIKYIEYWDTPMSSDVMIHWEKQCTTQYYFTEGRVITNQERNYTLSMKRKKQDKEFQKFIEGIIHEHFLITKNVDSNLNYLWYMYSPGGVKAGDYKPFILMAEMQLLKEMGYMDSQQIENLWSMLNSDDEDNFNIAWMALYTFKLARVSDHGEYDITSPEAYKTIEKYYAYKVLNHELFLKTSRK